MKIRRWKTEELVYAYTLHIKYEHPNAEHQTPEHV